MILDSSAVAPVPAPSEFGTNGTAVSVSDGRTTQRNLNSAPYRPADKQKPRREEFIQMAELLLGFRKLPAGDPKREILRNRFYGLFTELTRRDACTSLHARGINDPAEEAKDIAQKRAEVLHRQEQRGSGMFGKTSLDQRALEGYIRRAVQRGAYRSAEKLTQQRAKRGTAVPLDAQRDTQEEGVILLEIPVHGRDTLMEIAAKNLLARLKEKAARQPAGTTPIDWILAQASGVEIKPPKGSTRTLQRRIAEVRSLINMDLAGESISL